MTGKASSRRQQRREVCFLLDEGLPYKLADSLQEFKYPIVSYRTAFQTIRGQPDEASKGKDPWLILQMGVKGLTWITKDDEAKDQHEAEIRLLG